MNLHITALAKSIVQTYQKHLKDKQARNILSKKANREERKQSGGSQERGISVNSHSSLHLTNSNKINYTRFPV